MNEDIDALLGALSSDGGRKNEALIREFFKTPDGRRASELIGSLSTDEIKKLIGSAPKDALFEVLNSPERLKAVLNDPSAVEKLKRRLK